MSEENDVDSIIKANDNKSNRDEVEISVCFFCGSHNLFLKGGSQGSGPHYACRDCGKESNQIFKLMVPLNEVKLSQKD